MTAYSANRKHKTSDASQRIRQVVDELTYLPASAAVAVKFIEIGKDPDAGPREYEKIIAADPSLSAKLLSLANSSWFSVRNKVSKIIQAVNLLGLANVRTLAVSYCMAGVYNQLKLKREHISRYWEASLCKGVAAKTFAMSASNSLADEAFLAGLFQDIAMAVMHSAIGDEFLTFFEAQDGSVEAQIAAERERLGVDHQEVGHWLASKLELPQTYINAVASHHDLKKLSSLFTDEVLTGAVFVASLFPHVPERWSPTDVELLRQFLQQNHSTTFSSPDEFLEMVQKEFDTLFSFFQENGSPEMRLVDLLPEACEFVADATTSIVGQVQGMMSGPQGGAFVQNLLNEHQRLVHESRRDALTGTLVRTAFSDEATKAISLAGRYSAPFAVAFIDIDGFKRVNDTYGHQFGDFVLRDVCDRIRSQIRKTDLLGRLGGDEFGLLIDEAPADRVRAIVQGLTSVVGTEPFVRQNVLCRLGISIGVIYVPSLREPPGIEVLLEKADALMYQCKKTGTNVPRIATWSAQKQPAATSESS